ncbi:hypothetical protein GCM10007870_23590 [Gluconobacter kondonii]|uniref:Uncharacterized protein n=1 Tax=Gluconobacter kondonii TaxID=941463 RepID=A0ABQ5WUX1_9PROT|nr:hypothetical protein GCM10007870_23590 [Gluconobacter kondonii]
MSYTLPAVTLTGDLFIVGDLFPRLGPEHSITDIASYHVYAPDLYGYSWNFSNVRKEKERHV